MALAFLIVGAMPTSMTIALCLVYINNTLALFITDRYFKDQGAVARVVAILLVLNILLLPIKAAAHSFLKPSRHALS